MEFLRVTSQQIPQPLHLPLPAEARQAGLAGEELLHGGLFEVALLGDEPVQRADQRIHIAQRRRDGALFGEGRNEESKMPEIVSTLTDVLLLADPSLSLFCRVELTA